jgi:hypothetical protein
LKNSSNFWETLKIGIGGFGINTLEKISFERGRADFPLVYSIYYETIRKDLRSEALKEEEVNQVLHQVSG